MHTVCILANGLQSLVRVLYIIVHHISGGITIFIEFYLHYCYFACTNSLHYGFCEVK